MQTMTRLTKEERDLVRRIKCKWTEICNGLMHFTGTTRPLLLLEFQGYLDYLKIIEKKITSIKYEDFSQSNLVFTHDDLSRNDLSKMISKSYRDYYLRKEYFFKIFKNLLKTVSVNI